MGNNTEATEHTEAAESTEATETEGAVETVAEAQAPAERPGTSAAQREAESGRGQRKERRGTVVSAKMDKTIVVAVERRTAHPLYGKQLLRTKKFHAHDEDEEAREGDVVRIMETRPLSKTKRWRLIEVVTRAE
jgi:small subunit ribosomal protein S17